MTISKQDFEVMPDAAKELFELDGDTYRPKAEGKAAALKASLDALDGKFKSTDQQLKEILAKHEDDRTKAEEAALARLKKEGKHEEILADFERRANETKAQFEDRINKLSGRLKEKDRSLILGDVAKELNVFDDSYKLFSKLVQDRIDVDPETGKVTYLDEAGSATSLDKAGFIAELSKDKSFDRMRQAQANKGGNANGNNGSGGGASKTLTRAEFDGLSAQDKQKFSVSGGKIQD